MKEINLELHVRDCIYTQSSKRFKSFRSRGIIKTRFSVTLLHHPNDFERLVDKDWDKNLKSVTYKC